MTTPSFPNLADDGALALGLERPAPADLPTPFVEIDEARLDRNMKDMQARASAAGVRLFPHIKTHKSVALAEKQLAFGAAGVTASKPSEALVFVERGVPSLVLAYPIVQADALDRLLSAVKTRSTKLRLIAASLPGVDALSEAAVSHGMTLGVFLKVDVGLGRVGVKPDDAEALDVARRIAGAPGLSFAGLLSHAGHSYGAKGAEALDAIARREAEMLLTLADTLRGEGIAVPCISVGATPTCLGAPLPEGVMEIRPGNYALLDATALRLGICTPDQLALSVVARVVATNGDRFIVDAGSKTLTSDLGAHGTGGSGFGIVTAADEPCDRTWMVERLSEEHGFVRGDGVMPAIGSRVRIFPNHACPVMAQFDSVTLRRADGRSVKLNVDARGCQT